jgi:hypothetical protein
MQLAPLFLAWTSIALPLMAQMPQPPSDGLPAGLRSYFSLSDDQVRQIVGINERYLLAFGVFEADIERLRQQIAAETAKPVLDPATIGAAYVAIEQARRDQQSARTEALTGISQVLTPAQRSKLQTLRDALNLQPLVTAAIQSNFLLAPAPAAPTPPTPPASVYRKLPDRLPSVARGPRR